MTARLFVRPGRQDHKVLADLLAPGGLARQGHAAPLLGGVVVDATHAEARPQFAEAAAGVGLPVLVDPLTFFLQGNIKEGDPFLKLPYGDLAGVMPEELDIDRLVDTVIEFQVAHGATMLVVPHFHVTELESGWASLNLQLPSRTAQRCEQLGLKLPALSVLSGTRKSLSSHPGLGYVDAFVLRSRDAGVDALALCGSPAGKREDSYEGISKVVEILQRAARDLPVIAWRQGVYGSALTALGAAGYECGMGAGETTDIAAMQGRRRPKEFNPEKKKGGGPVPGVYLSPFGRSVMPAVAQALLQDQRVQGELVCDLPGCCSSIEQTLSNPRPHAIRARALELETLSAQPQRWRVQHQLRVAGTAVGTARRANEVLIEAGHTYRLPVSNLEALTEVLRFQCEGQARSA